MYENPTGMWLKGQLIFILAYMFTFVYVKYFYITNDHSLFKRPCLLIVSTTFCTGIARSRTNAKSRDTLGYIEAGVNLIFDFFTSINASKSISASQYSFHIEDGYHLINQHNLFQAWSSHCDMDGNCSVSISFSNKRNFFELQYQFVLRMLQPSLLMYRNHLALHRLSSEFAASFHSSQLPNAF